MPNNSEIMRTSASPSLINGLGGAAGFGENILAANDDRSTGEIDISPIFQDGLNFFGREFTSLWVNNNGSVTFNGPRGTFTPTSITGNNNNPEITPFFADVDTRGGTAPISPGGNSTGTNLVYYDFDAANDRFIVTWDDVGYFSSETDKTNAFQLILSDRGNGDFDIEFRYEDVDWTTGGASGGTNGLGGTPARAGFTASTGNPNAYFELPASGDENALRNLENAEGNTGMVGIWQFSVRSGDIDVAGLPELPDFNITGAITGDPHLVTLDGVAYDFHAAGEYTLLRATDGTDFAIQARMVPVTGSDNLTVNAAVALRAGGKDIMIDATDADPFSIDGVATDIANFNSTMIGDDQVSRANNRYTITLAGADGVINDGDSQIEVTVLTDRVDISMSLSGELAGNLEGLLGDGDGDASNDVAFANGTALLRPFAFEDLYGLYRDDWRVAEDDSLFTYDTGETYEGFYIEDHPADIASLSDFTDDQIAAATVTLLAAGLTEGTVNFNNALLDFLVTGDDSYIDSAADAPEVAENDDFLTFTGAELNRGTTADDNLVGTSGRDEFNGLAGDDTISGNGGRDLLRGGSGDDEITGGGGNDTIAGQTGDDTLTGGNGNDRIVGQAGSDLLVGGAGNDNLKGGGGRDEIGGGSGNDFMKGGTSRDYLDGGAGNDKLAGNNGSDALIGGAGNDNLKGGGGRDLLNGGEGNDFLKGGGGNDVFVFADGFDRDRIVDFDTQRDMLRLDSGLVGSAGNGAAVLNQFASVTGAGVVLDFGDGDVLTLTNLNSLAGLADDISIV
ncbi:MAG: nidogen-like domain-containing protein [Sulfitobacter sp.]